MTPFLLKRIQKTEEYHKAEMIFEYLDFNNNGLVSYTEMRMLYNELKPNVVVSTSVFKSFLEHLEIKVRANLTRNELIPALLPPQILKNEELIGALFENIVFDGMDTFGFVEAKGFYERHGFHLENVIWDSWIEEIGAKDEKISKSLFLEVLMSEAKMPDFKELDEPEAEDTSYRFKDDDSDDSDDDGDDISFRKESEIENNKIPSEKKLTNSII